MKQDNGEQQWSDWTQQLHDKLADHEVAAPDGLWDDIEAALPQQSPVARRMPLRRWVAAAAVAALIGTGALFWLRDTNSEAPTSMPTASAITPQSSAEDIEPDAYQASCDPTTPVPHVSMPTMSESIVAEKSTPAPATTESISSDVSEATSTDAPAPTQPTSPTQPNTPTQPITPTQPNRPITPTRPHRQPQLSLYAMNALGDHSSSNAVVMADALARTFTNDEPCDAAGSRQAPIFLAGYEESSHHRQPVAFGLQLGWPLAQRLTLTTGIVYTRLNAEFTQTMHSQRISRQQTLDYIGVPLGLSYQLWQTGRLGLYMAAGMQADWNVAAKQTVDGIRQQVGHDKMQWSANGSLGLQYNVMPQMAVYGEAGVNYYFDNGSHLQNYFKEHPTGLRLQLGLRINLHSTKPMQ